MDPKSIATLVKVLIKLTPVSFQHKSDRLHARMRQGNGRGIPLSQSHFSLNVSGLSKHAMVRTLLRGKEKHINGVQSISNLRSVGLKEKTGYFEVALETGAVLRRNELGTVLKDKFKLSLQCNLVTANKRSDSLYKTVT